MYETSILFTEMFLLVRLHKIQDIIAKNALAPKFYHIYGSHQTSLSPRPLTLAQIHNLICLSLYDVTGCHAYHFLLEKSVLSMCDKEPYLSVLRKANFSFFVIQSTWDIRIIYNWLQFKHIHMTTTRV